MISEELDGKEIENVGEFLYLRLLLTWNNDCGTYGTDEWILILTLFLFLYCSNN